MGVGQMDVAAVVLVCPLLVSIQALGLPYVELVSVRRGLELDVVLPRAVLGAYLAAEQTGYFLVAGRHHVGRDAAQWCLPWTGTDCSQGVAPQALVQASGQVCLPLVLAQAWQPVRALLVSQQV